MKNFFKPTVPKLITSFILTFLLPVVAAIIMQVFGVDSDSLVQETIGVIFVPPVLLLQLFLEYGGETVMALAYYLTPLFVPMGEFIYAYVIVSAVLWIERERVGNRQITNTDSAISVE